MSGVGALVGLALICASVSLVLKSFGWRGAPVFVCICIVGAFSLFSESFSAISEGLSSIALASDIGKYGEAVLKIIGVGYISGIGSELCTELGESSLSRAVAAGGRLEIILIAMPYFSEMLGLATDFLE